MKLSSAPPVSDLAAPTTSFAGGLLIALTLTRWLLPTEATADGETLWIAGLWFLAGAVLCLWPGGLTLKRRWDLADLGVILLIGGHVLSGTMVLATGGDRRAAVNLLWEWLSLGVFWFAWRAAISAPSIRRTIVPVLMVTAVTLAIWGLYQYFLWYPQMKAEYLPLIDRFRQLQAAGGDTSEVARKLAAAGIPIEEPGLTLFLNRLRDSHEPFGPFALANTFGGLLAAWLMIGVGGMTVSWGIGGGWPGLEPLWAKPRSADEKAPGLRETLQPRPPDATAILVGSVLLSAVGVLLIAVCLYLTNSRTAWGGLLAGFCVGGVMAIAVRIPDRRLRNALFPTATLIGILLGLGLLLLISQDVHAVPGPLKSLAYRAEYWRGTMALLRTSPWRGAQLGQFRDKYLMFKVPESSEEIADPHNLFLDIWANGGLVAMAGLLLLLVIVWRRIWQISRSGAQEHGSAGVENSSPGLPPSRQPSASPRAWIIPGLLGFAAAIAGQLYSTGVWDSHVDLLAVFAVVWGIVAVLWPKRLVAPIPDDSWLALLAVVVLSVHLLGAGGIAMPAVAQLWLLLMAWGLTPTAQPVASGTRSVLQPFPLLAAACCLILLAGWFATAERPVRLARHAIEQGDRLLSSRPDSEAAKQHYQSAAAFDPWSPEPWVRLANVAFAQTLADRSQIDREKLAQATEWTQAGIARAPFRPLLLIQKGDWLRDVARRTGERTDWIAASDAYRAAVERHPTNAALLANLAISLHRSGETTEAVEMARRAVAQDELNRQRGHTDRYLPDDILRQLQDILTVPSPAGE